MAKRRRRSSTGMNYKKRPPVFTIMAGIVALCFYLYEEYQNKNNPENEAASQGTVITDSSGSNETGVQATPKPGSILRIATYNVQNFTEEAVSMGNRIENLKKVVNELNADIIGLQEISNRNAMELVFSPKEWSLIIDDQSRDKQNTAFAVRKYIKVLGYKDNLDADDGNFLAPEKQYDQEFPLRRDGLVAEVKPLGSDSSVVLVNVHAKSRVGGRHENDNRREGHSRVIVEKLKTKYKNKNVVVLGDFNDSPDDRSLNILETGDINVAAGDNDGQGKFMINTCEPLWAANMVSHGAKIDRLDKTTGLLNNVFNTARKRNNDLRGTGTNTGPILFDQILVTWNMAPSLINRSANIFTKPVALDGIGYARPSDHLPVYIEIDYSKLK